MSRSIRKWMLRGLLGTLGLIIVLFLAFAFVLGTERGTQWVFDRAAAVVPAEIDIGDVSGTLLTEVAISSIDYVDDETTVLVENVSVNIDWAATNFAALSIERLGIQKVSLTSSTTEAKQPEPLQLSMPELPLGFIVEHIQLDSLNIDGTEIENIDVQKIGVTGKSIGVAAAGASANDILVRIRDVQVEVNGDVPVEGEIDWQIAETNWSGTGLLSGSLSELQISHELAGDYPLTTRGTVELLNQLQPVFDLRNGFEQLSYDEWTASNGQVRIVGTADEYRLSLASNVANNGVSVADIAGDSMGDLQGLSGLNLSAVSETATLKVVGDVVWSPDLSLDLVLSSNGIDPSKLADLPAGALNVRLRVQASDAENIVVDVVSLSGTWNGHMADASGQLSRRNARWMCRECSATVGENQVSMNGEVKGSSIAANVRVDAPTMQEFWPTLAGSMSGASKIRGTLKLPVLSGKLVGRELAFDDWRFAYLSVETGDATVENLNTTIVFRDGAFQEYQLGGGQLEFTGELDEFDVALGWQLEDYSAAASVGLAFDNELVSGLLKRASLTEPVSGTWSLDAPTQFSVGPDSQSVAAGAWSNEGAKLRHDRIEFQQDRLAVVASLSAVPLAIFNTFLPDNLKLDGKLNATVDLQNGADGWNGKVDWRQSDTKLSIIAGKDDQYTGSIPEAYLTASIVNNAPTLKAVLKSENELEAVLDASLSAMSDDANLRARFQFSGQQWDWVPRLFPGIEDFAGIIKADVYASGALISPNLRGETNWTDGALAMPGLNLPLSDIEMTLSGSNAGDMTVSGSARAGDGTLVVNGNLENVVSVSPSFTVNLSGDQVTLLNLEDYLLVASPELEFSGDLSGIHVAGSVDMDKAEINVRSLPEGAVAPSDDVVVVGREEQSRKKIRTTGEVKVLLSEDIHIKAFGLDTNLEGQLRFIVDEGREPRGMGELRLVGGVFAAYGQKLEIETGTMTFTGPLDNPLIQVRALRSIENISEKISVGIELKGRAKEVSSTLFSEPSMSQADILSYLVLGRPLDEATAADGSNLSSSAYALGLRQAAVITNQIGQSVGLDELRVSGSNQNTTELIAGKQINSKLYARYAYSVFSQIGKLLMRYKLTDSLSIEIGAGETQSMDVLYTVEKE